jgi:hypothetical protein
LNNGLTTACLVLLGHLKQSVQKHPKRITAAVASVLLTGGGGAFAVASLAPDPADLPVTTVTHAVESLAGDEPLSALVDMPGYSLYRSDTTRSADTAESLLQRLGIADPAASAFLRGDGLVRQNLLGRAGRSVSAETSDDHRLLRTTAAISNASWSSARKAAASPRASRRRRSPWAAGSRAASSVPRCSPPPMPPTSPTA